jgi:uncharacterized integral membrane protein
MTLSGGKDSNERLKAAVAARQEREATYAAKRPWQFPLIVGLAVAIVVGVVILVTVFGFGS